MDKFQPEVILQAGWVNKSWVLTGFSPLGTDSIFYETDSPSSKGLQNNGTKMGFVIPTKCWSLQITTALVIIFLTFLIVGKLQTTLQKSDTGNVSNLGSPCLSRGESHRNLIWAGDGRQKLWICLNFSLFSVAIAEHSRLGKLLKVLRVGDMLCLTVFFKLNFSLETKVLCTRGWSWIPDYPGSTFMVLDFQPLLPYPWFMVLEAGKPTSSFCLRSSCYFKLLQKIL